MPSSTEKRNIKKHNTSKIETLGLKNRLFDEMKKPDFNVLKFTKQLQEEGYDISNSSVNRYIYSSKEIQKDIIATDLRAAEEFKKITIDYTRALKSILDEVEEVKNDAKTERDFTTYNQLVGRLMQGIELIAKLSGDLNPKEKIDINIIYQQINNDIETKMKNISEKIGKPSGEILDMIKSEDEYYEQQIKKGEK
jgi:galactitol-specific phosphotransferase system IIB component